MVKSLSGLRRLRLQVVYDTTETSYQACGRRRELDSMTWPQNTYFWDSLMRLSTLPLTSVEIVVKSFRLTTVGLQWTKSDTEEEVAERLRSILLNPQGAEVYAEAKRREKEFYAKERERKAYVNSFKTKRPRVTQG